VGSDDVLEPIVNEYYRRRFGLDFVLDIFEEAEVRFRIPAAAEVNTRSKIAQFAGFPRATA
jgi:hypothetical protein